MSSNIMHVITQITNAKKPFSETTEEEYDLMSAINSQAAYLLI